MINKRIYVEKKADFEIAAQTIQEEIKSNFNLDLRVRLINIYDVFNLDENYLDAYLKTVFCEVNTDYYYFDFDLIDKSYICYQYLPAQYDQKADAAMQCMKLINNKSKAKVRTALLLVFDQKLSDGQLINLKNYFINQVESCEKDLNKFEYDLKEIRDEVLTFNNFTKLNQKELKSLLKELKLSMSFEDLKLIQDYFVKEARNPSESEIKVLDTYWSDHCRHTTFETKLNNIEFEDGIYSKDIKNSFQLYLQLKKEINSKKAITLMDMATINSKYLRKIDALDQVELSEENNACSVFVDLEVANKKEKWLMQFKNETHNHPTEIEPYGGAATCIGGAIRDPLSGRAYVYQAARISGCGDVLQDIDSTLENKLPQAQIAKKASDGYSSYGNQIGLATSLVKEIYDDSYCAKHLELGAVVGACKYDDIQRTKPLASDVVILLGGKTGKDGIGGATGSSISHSEKSLLSSKSEVQKGNAVEERKIQRLFLNPEASKLIKKCNDFGAGGVAVAIGELADGLVIDLDKVKCKYQGLTASQIAISESQERMAVVVSKENVEKFIALSKAENLDAYQVAEITNDNRLVMYYQNEKVVDISYDFINTSGYQRSMDVLVKDDVLVNSSKEYQKDDYINILSTKNVASNKGLIEKFDSSIGSLSVLMPLGGKNQTTPTQASVSKFPTPNKDSNLASILTYGFKAELMKQSTYTGSQFAVLESISKTIACGGSLKNIYFSFQEYFRKLEEDKAAWGEVFKAMLGTIKVLSFFDKAAIGGKDSMSGTFNNLNVVPTLVSFACSTALVSNIISNELKELGNNLYLYLPHIENNLPNLESYEKIYSSIEENIKAKNIISAQVVEDGGIFAALYKMAIGNSLGFEIKSELDLLSIIPGAIIVESKVELNDALYLGKVTNNFKVNKFEFSQSELAKAYNSTFSKIYPVALNKTKQDIKTIANYEKKNFKNDKLVKEVSVLIPVFPGTNCELDMANAFNKANAQSKILVFNNLNEAEITKSIDELALAIENCQILALAGGFSAADEPDGSAKFIVSVLKNEKIKKAIDKLRANGGLIIGICNGFQALIKSGLLPYGQITDLNENAPTLFKNDLNRHISTIVKTRVCSKNSPFLTNVEVDDVYNVPISHGEGKFVCSKEVLEELIANNQIAFQYCDEFGQASNNENINVNGSTYAIEGIVSKDGRILGKMGHSERISGGIYKNIIGKFDESMFKAAVNYFRNGD